MTDYGMASGEFNGKFWYEYANRDKGHNCGECGRLLKTYHRRLSRSMARSLVRLYKLHETNPGKDWFHVKHFDKEGARGEFGVLSAWGLVVGDVNNDQKKRAGGYWAITDFGKRFVKLEENVPQYVMLKWGSEILGFSGPMVSVKQCLEHGNHFKYADLMDWVPEALL